MRVAAAAAVDDADADHDYDEISYIDFNVYTMFCRWHGVEWTGVYVRLPACLSMYLYLLSAGELFHSLTK